MLIAKFLAAIGLLAIAAAVGVLLGMLDEKLRKEEDKR